jgi:hypothetical protein
MLYIQYTGLGGTNRTRESAGLARGFAIWGLDRIFEANDGGLSNPWLVRLRGQMVNGPAVDVPRSNADNGSINNPD